MRYLLTALLLFPTLVFAEELHTFKNGEVADADKLNESLQYILNNASGGCSVEQVNNTAEITCADGTTAVVPGYGTVVVYPEGLVAEANVGTVNTGDIVIVDDAGVVLGPADGGSSGDRFSTSVQFDDGSACEISIRNVNGTVDISSPTPGYFQSNDCSGQMLIIDNGFCQNPTGEQWLMAGERIAADLLIKSRLEGEQCFEQNAVFSANRLTFPINVTLPSEILNAAYPVRLEQLP